MLLIMLLITYNMILTIMKFKLKYFTIDFKKLKKKSFKNYYLLLENNLSYHCPIWITDFSDEGVTPFQCLHILCNDCNKEFKSRSKYNCPLCRANVKMNLQYNIDNQTNKDMLDVILDWKALQYIQNQTDEICKAAIRGSGMALKYIRCQTDELCKLGVQKTEMR